MSRIFIALTPDENFNKELINDIKRLKRIAKRSNFDFDSLKVILKNNLV